MQEKLDEGSERATLSGGVTGNFVHMAATDTMILLSGVDEVKIDGKSTDYVDRGIQIAVFYDLCDFLV